MNIKKKHKNKKNVNKNKPRMETQAPVLTNEKILIKEDPKNTYLDLNITEIRSDLKGMLMFAVISLIVILLLKYYDINLYTFLGVFKK